MSLIRTIKRAEGPCRLLLCNSGSPVHLMCTARAKSRGPGVLGTLNRDMWDASDIADLPDKIRKVMGNEFFEYKGDDRVRFMIRIRKDQEFRQERYDAFGPDLAAATFIIPRLGKVKFTKFKRWTHKDSGISTAVPNKKDDSFLLEGIDASGMLLLPNGIDNFVNLEHLKYLNISKLRDNNGSDHHLFRLSRFQATLEFLDISDNPRITDNGLASLYTLRNLKCLNIKNCTGLVNPEIVCSLLTEFIPDLTVIGLDTFPESDLAQEYANSRFLSMGELVDTSGENVPENLTQSVEDSVKDADSETQTVNRDPLKEAASL